jgi:hypothetical protein
MLRNCDDTLGFEPIHRKANLAGWSPPASSWHAVAAVRMMWDAFCEGLAAHREYEALRSRGIGHGRALREALGLGCSRLQRETVTPLYFAGRGIERRSRPPVRPDRPTAAAKRKP